MSWILSNLPCEDFQNVETSNKLIEAGIIDIFIKFMYSKDPSIVENGLNGLANICVDSASIIRDYLLDRELMDIIKAIYLKWSDRLDVMKSLAFLISNLLVYPYPRYHQILSSLMPIINKLVEIENENILDDCLWALSNISNGDEHCV